MFDGIYFEFPKILFVIGFFIACETLCKMRLPSIYFPHAKLFLKSGSSSSKLLFFLKWLGIIFLIFALMSPVKDEPYELAPKNGYEMVLILDASESMYAKGFDQDNFSLTRFDVVKNIVKDFIKKRENDNLGLIVFGSYSFIASPLTYDKHILSNIVSQLQIGMAGRYTALYESLAQAVNILKNTKAKTKIAILLTDGYSTRNVDKIPLNVALDMLKKEHIKVYPIGIGQDINVKVLKKIAKESGGVAFGASNAKELQMIYNKIDELEKSKIKAESFSYLKYYYTYPLFLSLLCLMFYIYLRNKRGAV